jgi:four helix bundle protein
MFNVSNIEMAGFKSFEDMDVWKLARSLSLKVYKLSSRQPFFNDFALRDQIRRAVISISSNMAEGFEREGNKEFVQFLSIAKASTAEVRSQLYLAFDLGYINNEEFEQLKLETLNVGKTISGLIKYLRSSELKGSKYSANIEL